MTLNDLQQLVDATIVSVEWGGKDGLKIVTTHGVLKMPDPSMFSDMHEDESMRRWMDSEMSVDVSRN